MKMTYVDPQGNRTAAAPTNSQNVPVVDISVKSQPAVPASNSRNIPSSAEEFRKFIEVEVLDIIKNLMEKGYDKDKIQAIARSVLTLIKPEMSLDELYRNAVKLDDQYSELGPVVLKIMKAYEEKYEKKAITEVSTLVRNGKYTEAQDLVKKVLLFKSAG